jgi:hypothetical protein
LLDLSITQIKEWIKMTERVKHTKNYTVIDNQYLRNKKLSLKAMGLLTLMLSLPDDWQYSISGLAHCVSEGKCSIRAALVELENAGYVQRRQEIDKSGKFCKIKYIIRESPVSENPPLEEPSSAQPLSENPTTGDPATCDSSTDFRTQINIEGTKTEKQKTDQLSTNVFPFPYDSTSPEPVKPNGIPTPTGTMTAGKPPRARPKFVAPSVDEVRAYCQERGNGIDAAHFVDYYTARGWMVGKTEMCDWKAAVRTWEAKDTSFKSSKKGMATALEDYQTPETQDRMRQDMARMESYHAKARQSSP